MATINTLKCDPSADVHVGFTNAIKMLYKTGQPE